ncbi:MAG TPA: hypothetical protein VKR41_07460 [Puia sp.]|nr:hypothetical protein [Puia sp.]
MQADGDIGEMLEYGDLAAPDLQTAGELFVQVLDGQVNDPFLLGEQEGDSYTDEDQENQRGKPDKAEESFSRFWCDIIETLTWLANCKVTSKKWTQRPKC